ncbi:MAG: hypothetical protein KDB74_11315 [Flavobacteriales bacterium]|nr:hypothetical protein [Flavobacteriales bacterium]
MKKTFKKWTFLIASISILVACTDDYFEFDKIKTSEWSPEFALPLVKSSLTLENILSNKDSSGIISTNADNVLEIVYEGNVISGIGSELAPLPDFTEVTTINAIPGPPPGVSVTIPYKDTTVINVQNGVEVDSILYKSGKLAFNFNSTVRHPVEVTISFPSFKDENKNVLSQTLSIPPYDGNSPSVRASIVELKDYTGDFTLNGTSFNKLPYELSVKVTGIAGPPPGSLGNIQLTTNMRDVEYKRFNGYVGQDPMQLKEDTILIGLFKNFKNGTFYLSNPTLDIKVSNSYGMPLNLNFNYLNALMPESTPSVKAINLGANNPVSLLYPTSTGTETTNIRLDKNTSNIPEIIKLLVKKIAYDADAFPNPTGRTVRNYFTDTSSIGLDVKLTLPLEGYASGFIMQDTIEFEFDVAENLKEALLKTRIKNGFPTQGELQLIFTDNKYVGLDSAFSLGQEVIIPPAPVDANGDAVGISEKNTDAVLTSEKLKKIKDTKFLIIKAEVETTNGSGAIPDTVRFRPSYKLDVEVGIKASILID